MPMEDWFARALAQKYAIQQQQANAQGALQGAQTAQIEGNTALAPSLGQAQLAKLGAETGFDKARAAFVGQQSRNIQDDLDPAKQALLYNRQYALSQLHPEQFAAPQRESLPSVQLSGDDYEGKSYANGTPVAPKASTPIGSGFTYQQAPGGPGIFHLDTPMAVNKTAPADSILPKGWKPYRVQGQQPFVPGYALGTSNVIAQAAQEGMQQGMADDIVQMRRQPGALTLFGIGAPDAKINAAAAAGRIKAGASYKKGTAKVPGKGDGTKDTVHAKLAPGEAVLNKGAAEHVGRGLIDHLNAIGAQKMGMA